MPTGFSSSTRIPRSSKARSPISSTDSAHARPWGSLASASSLPRVTFFRQFDGSQNAIRSLFEALGSERFPIRASWLGERELDLRVYEREIACDWTSGSFMLVRWEALQSARLHG